MEQNPIVRLKFETHLAISYELVARDSTTARFVIMADLAPSSFIEGSRLAAVTRTMLDARSHHT